MSVSTATSYHVFVVEDENGFHLLYSTSEDSPKPPTGSSIVEKLTTSNLQSWWPRIQGTPFWKSETFEIKP